MNTEKTGGAAFPTALNDNTIFRDNHKTLNDVDGMTLLDYFAAKAMQSELHNWGKIPDGQSARILVAQKSYLMAAAMIEERNKYI